MDFAVKPTHERGRRLSDAEIAALQPVIGNLTTYEYPREPGGRMRRMASVSTPGTGDLIKPIVEPRLWRIADGWFAIRGLEEFNTERGWVYVLQEWLVEERPNPPKPP